MLGSSIREKEIGTIIAQDYEDIRLILGLPWDGNVVMIMKDIFPMNRRQAISGTTSTENSFYLGLCVARVS